MTVVARKLQKLPDNLLEFRNFDNARASHAQDVYCEMYVLAEQKHTFVSRDKRIDTALQGVQRALSTRIVHVNDVHVSQSCTHHTCPFHGALTRATVCLWSSRKSGCEKGQASDARKALCRGDIQVSYA